MALPNEIEALEDTVAALLERELKGEDVRDELEAKLEELKKMKVHQAETSSS